MPVTCPVQDSLPLLRCPPYECLQLIHSVGISQSLTHLSTPISTAASMAYTRCSFSLRSSCGVWLKGVLTSSECPAGCTSSSLHCMAALCHPPRAHASVLFLELLTIPERTRSYTTNHLLSLMVLAVTLICQHGLPIAGDICIRKLQSQRFTCNSPAMKRGMHKCLLHFQQ